mmetsp:Transcript_108458/g.242172  ORF Transcript_108458/g.242172 Transcript_108458/m.242172 type:complete len:157 (+) Transcript_108458:1-471(+)
MCLFVRKESQLVKCELSEWLDQRRLFFTPFLAEMLGKQFKGEAFQQNRRVDQQDDSDDSERIAGVWFFNKGKSYYKIMFDTSEQIHWYIQPMAAGKILRGAVSPTLEDDSEWQWEADLNNGGCVRLRRDGIGMLSSYRKPNGETWMAPISAKPRGC